MASTASLEASEIRRRGRQRLIGAITLVLMLVVFVPMLLDSQPRPTRDSPSATIPPKENAPALPAPSPAPATAPAPAAKAPVVAPVESPKAAAVAPEPATKPEAVAPPKGFVVQVGAFRDEDKLKVTREKLAASGVVHYSEKVEVASGPLTRLRAGPFATREAAEAALATLKLAALDGKVVPLP